MTKVRKKAKADPIYVSSLDEVALVYGRSNPMMQNWFTDGCPGKNRHGYDLVKIGDWIKESGKWRQGRRPVEGAAPSATAEKHALETELLKLRLAEKRGEYAKRDDVERAVMQALTTLRLLLEAIPGKCALLVPPDHRIDVKNDVQDHINTTLRTIRRLLAGLRADRGEGPGWMDDAMSSLMEAVDAFPAHCAELACQKDREKIIKAGERWI